MYDEKEKCDSRYPNIERRKKLPDPVEKERGVSLWSMIKDNVGKDLTRVCLPVYFNEPISSLQKCFEDLEYSYLLDRAYEYGKAVRLKFMNSQCLVSRAPEFMYLHWWHECVNESSSCYYIHFTRRVVHLIMLLMWGSTICLVNSVASRLRT